MNRNSSELDIDDRQLLAELAGELDAYKTPPPPPAAREAAARAAAALLERDRPSPARSLWQQLRIQARFLPLWYYGASLALCALGVALLHMPAQQASRVAVVIGMAPLPALLGLLELFHGADEGMGEIESACRYSPARVMSARMLIVGALSAACAVALGVVSGAGQGWLAAGIVVVPFCAGSALGLGLSAALHGRASSAQVALAIALVNGAAAAAAQTQMKELLSVTPVAWALAMAVSALALVGVLKIVLSEHSRMMERKLLQWN